ncbi:PREDICTED: carcinoembryonic antigen-related cell adhesion molecule 3 isoform X7 [Rhinopithecus bieti]|uniref:carcinoembryonic antigen-related cell adhesion molecule 3 isoform X7 n=1 Tax=Rhinopithecus bieti TaxID=61621 RepID=UPI00083C2CA0|nr:PREDICTED: carcinoembryonic antigen-related cell adhesion molecule 3 isoform X7 [Rhinopithecus bieti]
MGPPSAPPCRMCVPWKEVVLTASLLTFWNPPTTAQLTIESRPFNVAEGKEVLLLAHNLPQNLVGYIWYKGERVDASHRIGSYVIGTQQTTPGPAHSGRETIYSNASLLIQNITQNDTGSYTIQAIKEDLVNEKATGQFRVYPELPKPSITSNNSNPVEDKDAVDFTCEPDIHSTTYLWWVNGQSLPVSPRLQLSNGNRTLTLLSVKRNDAGAYECEIQNPVGASCSDPVTLDVLYGPGIPTISPPDSYYHPGANLNLSCHVASNPPTQYSWFVSGMLQQHTQKLLIANITVDNSGSYACLAHNSATGLSTITVKTITVSGENAPGLPVGAIAGMVTGVLVGVVLVAALVYFLLLAKTRRTLIFPRTSIQRDLKEQQPQVLAPGRGPSHSSAFLMSPLSTAQASQPGPRTAAPIYEAPSLFLQEMLKHDTNVYCRMDRKGDVAS